jgi:cell division protein FtsB
MVFAEHIAGTIPHMREFKKHRSHRSEMLNFSLRLGGALALLFITAGAVNAAWGMYGRLSVASTGQQEAQAQLHDLQTQEAGVAASVDQLSSQRGQEAIMREHYGVVKPGEGVIQIVHTAPTSTPANTSGNSWIGSLFHTLFPW